MGGGWQVARVQGILDAYCYALSNVTLWGPTNFADVIKVDACLEGVMRSERC